MPTLSLQKNYLVIQQMQKVWIPLILTTKQSFKDLIISIIIKENITVIIYLGFILITSSNVFPIKLPRIGIKKWNIPTNKDTKNIFLFEKFINPYASDILKASKLKLIESTIADVSEENINNFIPPIVKYIKSTYLLFRK